MPSFITLTNANGNTPALLRADHIASIYNDTEGRTALVLVSGFTLIVKETVQQVRQLVHIPNESNLTDMERRAIETALIDLAHQIDTDAMHHAALERITRNHTVDRMTSVNMRTLAADIANGTRL